MNYFTPQTRPTNFLFVITIIVCGFILSGCITARPSLEQQVRNLKHEKLVESTTRQDFYAIEPLLKNIKKGAPINGTNLDWKIYQITNSRGGTQDYIVASQGWLGPLSGGTLGGFYKFGIPAGRLGSKVYGRHVYGYTWRDINLTPQYVLTTEATVVPEEEYNKLNENEKENIGSFQTPGDVETTIYFKDVLVKKIQKLHYKTPPSDTESLKITPNKNNYLSKEAFNKSKEALKTIQPGTNLLEVINQLGGLLVKLRENEGSMVMGMNGFLNYDGDFIIRHMNNNGYFFVFPFGYLENDKEVPKIALIFKNDEFYKTTPYTSPDQLKEFFR